jgi:hypothetical protein
MPSCIAVHYYGSEESKKPFKETNSDLSVSTVKRELPIFVPVILLYYFICCLYIGMVALSDVIYLAQPQVSSVIMCVGL